MRILRNILIVGMVMTLFSAEAKGAKEIYSFDDLIPDRRYCKSVNMDDEDNLMVRDPVTGEDSVVEKDGSIWHIGFVKYVPEGMLIGGYASNDNYYSDTYPGYEGWCQGLVYSSVFSNGDRPDDIMIAHDPDGGPMALLYANGTLAFEDNIRIYFAEDVEFNGVQGDLNQFPEFMFVSGNAPPLPHMVINPVTASEPFPADGDEDIDLNVELRWTGAYGSVHNVYFGVDPDNLIEVSHERVESAIDVQGLGWAMTFYWRVDEVDGDGVVHPGRVWTFDTIDDCSSSIAGDVNGDCVVDLRDFAKMAANWLRCTRLGTGACY